MANVMFHKDDNSEATPDIPSSLEEKANEIRDICSSEDTALEFTEAELSYLVLCATIYECFRDQRDGSVNKKAPETTLLQEINVWLRSKADNSLNADIVTGLQGLRVDQDFKVPRWEILHNAFMTLDALKLLAFILHEKAPRGRTGDGNIRQAAFTYTRRLVTGVYEEVRSKIIGLKNELSETSAKQRLVNAILGKEDGHQYSIGPAFEALMSVSWTEAFTARVINSWREALDGVLHVKID